MPTDFRLKYLLLWSRNILYIFTYIFIYKIQRSLEPPFSREFYSYCIQYVVVWSFHVLCCRMYLFFITYNSINVFNDAYSCTDVSTYMYMCVCVCPIYTPMNAWLCICANACICNFWIYSWIHPSVSRVMVLLVCFAQGIGEV